MPAAGWEPQTPDVRGSPGESDAPSAPSFTMEEARLLHTADGKVNRCEENNRRLIFPAKNCIQESAFHFKTMRYRHFPSKFF